MPKKITPQVKYALAFDPGWNTGFAIVNSKYKVISAGVIAVPRKIKGFGERVDHILTGVMRLFNTFNCMHFDAVIIESQQLWSANAVSMASASKGDLIELAQLAGILWCEGFNSTSRYPLMVTPGKWKGQLPKEIVAKRVQKYIPKLPFKDHEMDAIGMCVSYFNGWRI
jgi:hypothetical protein